MKRFLLLASFVLMVCSCSNHYTAKMNVTVKGADTTNIVIYRLNFNNLQPIDTVSTDNDGSFAYKVALKDESPAFYYLFCNDTKLASMILLPGDKVKIEADLNGNYDISGSEESVKLKEIETEFSKVKSDMAIVAAQVEDAVSEADVKAINAQLSRMYVNYKRELSKRMMTDQTSLTSAIVAFYKINDNLPVFNENTDAIMFRTVATELSKVYPKSEYVQALFDEAAKRERNMEFEYRLSEYEEVGFPDITMPDVDGQDKSLSELKGNVILLMFWAPAMDEHRMFNHELLELYSKYHSKGFEIYQVAIDINKAEWASVVKAQELPWINVNDGFGIDSPTVLSYNVQSLPTAFVISRDGDVFAKDLTSADAIETQVKKLL